MLYKYAIAQRCEGFIRSFGTVIAPDVDVPAAHAAGCHLMTYAETGERCSAPAVAQLITGQRVNSNHCCLLDSAFSVQNKHGQ